ncbi:peptidylprolyl isomerase [uncultured Sneathiella sp.]|jgi:peptidyl-prolyl cis-trans isomerase SurA|uniref:peptidylprolyl isomerase n=1 Tax=uncultured Sneathiella sp. TaxID=879315 RepID=UPI0030D7377A|tara:strand:- start:550 stop:1824 length:1275 start_codon:yes stop_codon:yes gene_type:complete
MLICRTIRNTLLAGLAALLVLSTAAAQDVQKIVAVVNDEVISGYDLNQRIKLTIILSGFPDTQQTRQQLVDPTVARLIDDRLKMQEAARYNITVSDEEVLNAIAYLEETNGMQPGQMDRMLRQNNIDIETMTAQVRANLIWNRLIEARIMPRITISDEEVEAVRQAMEANKGKTEYLLSEIYLPIEPSAPETQVRDSIANLVSQLRSGASFERAASQFSQGATAASGGSIGWVLEEDVEPEIAEILPDLGTNRISDPLRSGAGFYIVTVKATRTILENNPDDISLDITQIVVPEAAEGAANAGPEAQEKLATTVSNFIDGCEKLPEILTELNSPLSGKIGRIRLGDMPDHIKEILRDMDVGDVSTPYFDEDVYRIFVVCERNDPQARSNDPETIRREILLRRAENRARGYMQDIHTAATIETRL